MKMMRSTQHAVRHRNHVRRCHLGSGVRLVSHNFLIRVFLVAAAAQDEVVDQINGGVSISTSKDFTLW